MIRRWRMDTDHTEPRHNPGDLITVDGDMWSVVCVEYNRPGDPLLPQQVISYIIEQVPETSAEFYARKEREGVIQSDNWGPKPGAARFKGYQ